MSVIESALRRAEQEAATESEARKPQEPVEDTTSEQTTRSWPLIVVAIIAFVGIYAAMELNKASQVPVAHNTTTVTSRLPDNAPASNPKPASGMSDEQPVLTAKQNEITDTTPASNQEPEADTTVALANPEQSDPVEHLRPDPIPTPDAAAGDKEASAVPTKPVSTPKPTPPKRLVDATKPDPADSAPEVHVEALTGKDARSVDDKYRLECVMISGASRMAVVNGTLVRVGQEIDGAKVTSIKSRHIVLSVDGREYRIPLRAEDN